MDFLNSQIAAYIDRYTSPETDTLKELVRLSGKELEHTDMLSGIQIGQLLKLLIRIGKCRRVLEIGTFTGYSAIWMADALPDDGELITLEMNEQYSKISGHFFSREPYRRKIRQIMGPALETMDTLDGEFDLVFVDADKVQYPDYYLKLKPKLKTGGVLFVDNVLWGGEVINPDDPKSKSISRLNKLIQDDSDFENVMLPVRDGITIAVKL